jgi:transposase
MLQDPATPEGVAMLPEVVRLRRVWIQQFFLHEGELRWRDSKEMPPAALSINSPHDDEARYSIKRDTTWSGYKAHYTETCEEEAPHLIVHVETTPGTTQDSEVTETIHADLQEADLLPARHLADEAYLDAELLVESQRKYEVDLYGPVAREGSWQARAGQGFAMSDFAVDWEQRQVRCPEGQFSVKWQSKQDAYDNPLIHASFAPADCNACNHRSLRTQSKTGARELSFRPEEQYQALQAARERQKTEEFFKEYGLRAGIEGTLSQGVHTYGLRRSRYVGRAKTHLQNLLIAAALNLVRMIDWLKEIPRSKTRSSSFVKVCLST